MIFELRYLINYLESHKHWTTLLICDYRYCFRHFANRHRRRMSHHYCANCLHCKSYRLHTNYCCASYCCKNYRHYTNYRYVNCCCKNYCASCLTNRLNSFPNDSMKSYGLSMKRNYGYCWVGYMMSPNCYARYSGECNCCASCFL